MFLVIWLFNLVVKIDCEFPCICFLSPKHHHFISIIIKYILAEFFSCAISVIIFDVSYYLMFLLVCNTPCSRSSWFCEISFLVRVCNWVSSFRLIYVLYVYTLNKLFNLSNGSVMLIFCELSFIVLFLVIGWFF